MLPPSCSRCGTPIPAGPADPSRPDLCGACASRATEEALGAALAERSSANSSWGVQTRAGAGPGAATPDVVIVTRPLDGLLTGVAGAGLACLAWWAAATQVSWDYWGFASIVVGLAIGVSVLIGARQGGAAPGAMALVIGALSVVVTVYFISRSIDIRDAPRPIEIPLWTDLGGAKDLVKGAVDADTVNAIGLLGAPIAAAVVAGWPGRRPLVG